MWDDFREEDERIDRRAASSRCELSKLLVMSYTLPLTPLTTLTHPYPPLRYQHDKLKMHLEPFPAWPAEDQGRLLHIEPKDETPHHRLGLQHYEVPVKNEQGEVVEWSRHDWDLVKPKPEAPKKLDEEEWARMMEAPEEVAAMKYRRVVRVRYRHKVSGVIVSPIRLAEITSGTDCLIYA